jgi:nitroreductase
MQTTLSAHEANELKKAPAVEGVLPVFHERWSPRSYIDREVSPALLRKVFEAARWAPSSSNEQPWRYVVGTRGSETWEKIFQTLVEVNQKWARRVPVLMLGTTHTKFSKSGSENRFAMHDLGAASTCMALQAAAVGLAVHQMGGFSQEAARKALGVPEEYAIGSVIALGYQGEPAALDDERMMAQESSARTRRPLSEMVFSAWGEAAKM